MSLEIHKNNSTPSGTSENEDQQQRSVLAGVESKVRKEVRKKKGRSFAEESK
jgi:hypothetical protein